MNQTELVTIKAVSIKRIEEGSIGYLIEEDPNSWRNINASPEVLKKLIETTFQKGNQIKIYHSDDEDDRYELVSKAEKEEKKEELDLIDFETLLNDAHDKFKDFSVTSTAIEIDRQNKYALFKVQVKIGENVYEAHGDSTADNISGQFVKPHFIRMAETRALARALRWATNNAKCADVETENGELSEEKNKSKK